MHDVSSFIDELAKAAGSSERMREMIADAAGISVSGPMISMWKRRGIPWPVHDPMRRVCAQLGLPADPVVWRRVRASEAA